MENEQQQMNKITDILAGVLQFLVRRNLGKNIINNGVPHSTSQQEPLGHNTPEQVPPVDRNDNDQGHQTNQTDHNTPFGVLPSKSQKSMVLGQTTQSRVLFTRTDTG